MRTFIAIDLDAGLKASLEALVGELGRVPDSRSVRWVGTGGMHLTLKFLGEVAEEQAALGRGFNACRQFPHRKPLGAESAFFHHAF